MVANPFYRPVPRNGNGLASVYRRAVEPIACEFMENFGTALDGPFAKNHPDRIRANTLLRIGGAAMEQARHVAHALVAKRMSPFGTGPGTAAALEAALASSTLRANITDFITQMIHTSLDVYPRLIAPRLVSIQPFTQPSGYAFYLERIAKDDGPTTGAGADRNLSDLSEFDSEFSLRQAEGEQVRMVGVRLGKTLVECEWRALGHQESHEVEVALRSQYDFPLMEYGDMIVADEMAWEVDRTVVDRVVAFAATNPRGPIYWDSTAGGTYDSMAPSEQQAYDRRFLEVAMSQASVEMAHDIFKQPNWHVAGTNVIKLMARTPGAYATMTDPKGYADQQRNTGGIIQTGVMKDGSIVLHDPQMDPDTMVSGFISNMDPFYAGAIMMPFGLASLLTAAFQNPDTLMTTRSRALAFATHMVRNKQFRTTILGVES